MGGTKRGWAAAVVALAGVGACDAPPGDGDTGTDTGEPLVTGPCTGAGAGGLAVGFGEPGGGPWLRAPEVWVFGPSGELVARLTEAATLEDLPGGDYVVEVHRGEGTPAGARLGAIAAPEVPLSRVCVGDGATTPVDVAWTPREGRVRISSGESIVGFGEADLDAGGDRAPADRLDATLINDFRGLAVARTGHLWAAASPTYGSRLLVWGAEDLDGTSVAAPLELASPVFADFADIADLAFGDDGTLWVAMRQPGGPFAGLVGFSRATLAEVLLGGDPVVAPDVQRPIDGIVGRVDLEVGPDGAVWVADFDGDRLLRIDDPWAGGTGADAVVRGFLEPVATGADPAPLYGPENLAFDDAGDAVVLYWVSGMVVRLPGAAMTGSGPTDVVVPSDSLFVDQLPTGLVIDGLGDVWVGNYAGGGVGELLRWNPGSAPTPWLSSDAFPDPADVVLDPRPR